MFYFRSGYYCGAGPDEIVELECFEEGSACFDSDTCTCSRENAFICPECGRIPDPSNNGM